MNTADAVHLKDAIDAIAHAMVCEGRPESLPQLRSEALAGLARPTEHGTLPQPDATLVVHLAQEALEGDTAAGVARADTIGPLLLEQVHELLAHHRVRLLPVLDLASNFEVDAYEIPDRIRTQLQIREPFSVFPFSTIRSVHADLDHTIPYRGKRSTRADPAVQFGSPWAARTPGQNLRWLATPPTRTRNLPVAITLGLRLRGEERFDPAGFRAKDWRFGHRELADGSPEVGEPCGERDRGRGRRDRRRED